MRKILIGAALLIGFGACNQPEAIEQQARRQMEKTIASFYEGNKHYQIENVENFYSNDSVCVIKFVFLDRYRDDNPHRCEYVFLKQKEGNSELLLDLEAEKSIEQSAREYAKATTISVEKAMGSTAYLRTMLNGRKIDESK